MKQVVQHQKSGEILFEEMPVPQCHEGGILVATECSLISAGTEKTGVENAKSSLLDRARKQPDQVKLVLDFIKKEGIRSTVNRVLNKLDSFKTPGYSLSGRVIETRTAAFSVGDRVACAGAGYAVHSEIITVPKNLAVKIPENVSFESAAYTTVGSIAMQGVRQADLRLGETACVIGLGLIGQITIKLLKASGCKVVGADINEKLFPSAIQAGADAVFLSSKESVAALTNSSGGLGFDAVLITAGTESSEPADIAMHIARKRGKVIVVGAVGMNLKRSPFYEKEIDFKISCSYGPGRYDPAYEELGIDYPAGFVRWTENRNMQAFLSLISDGKMEVESLTTHRFSAEKAAEAYDIVIGKNPVPFTGIILQYPEHKEKSIRKEFSTKPYSGKLGIALIGAGSFAQSQLLPPLKASGVVFETVTTATPANAQSLAKHFGFSKADTNSFAAIEDPNVHAIFCASRHDSHAAYVIKSLECGKPIFVEKPLCADVEQLLEIEKTLDKHPGRVMVGFNRRFSESFRTIRKFFEHRTDPMMIKYRVNAGFIPLKHWLYAPGQGNGRIVGEACHFIDCMVYLTGSLPVKVYAESVSSNNPDSFDRDNAIITIKFADGSVGAVEYVACGDSALPKEYCEVFCDRSAAVMNNFMSVDLVRGGNTKTHKFDGRKGIAEEISAVVKAFESGKPAPIKYEEIRAVTLASFAANESLDTGAPVSIEL